MSILEATAVTKKLSGQTILNQVSLKLEKGKIYGLLGPNGAGKTTFIKTLIGMYNCTSGTIKINGYSISKDFENAIENIGVIVESPSFYENLSGLQNLNYVAKLNKGITKEQIEKVLKTVKLDKKKNVLVKNYSLGMKQRLGLALTLLKDPKILILDEPTNGLDPQGIIDLREHLIYLSRDLNKCILVSSHLLTEIENICDEVAFMRNGELIHYEKITKQNTSNFKIEVSDIEFSKKILNKLSIEFELANESTQNRLLLRCKSSKEFNAVVNELIQNEITVTELVSKKRDLEEIFLEINKIG
ncbi:ABC transporter ATP-binding protein [Alkalihalobacillus sp. FSL R5-0424]